MSTIPKIIHYCWFGGGPIPEKDQACIASWKERCPDYEIKEWNESNYDVTKNAYMRQAYEVKKWGFVPDYARLDIVYTHGGIYLDTDVEIIRSLDDLLEDDCFMGFEDHEHVALGLGFGAAKGNAHIKAMRDVYEEVLFVQEDGSLNTLPSPQYTTAYLKERGLQQDNSLQTLDGIRIYPVEYFCPRDYFTGQMNLTENSYTIHHYNASWYSKDEKKAYERRLALVARFGPKVGLKINQVISYSLLIPNSLKKNGVKGTVHKVNRFVGSLVGKA